MHHAGGRSIPEHASEPHAPWAEQVADPSGAFLSWASAHWREVSSLLLGKLAEFASGRRGAVAGTEAFCIAHLCGERGETRARAIESANGEQFARASALAALGYLVRARAAMSDADMRAYLRRIRRDMGPRSNSVLWMTWASIVANLGYADMRAETTALTHNGLVPDGDFKERDFDERIELAAADATGLTGFERDLIAPLDDATSSLLWLASFEAAQAGRRLRAVVERC